MLCVDLFHISQNWFWLMAFSISSSFMWVYLCFLFLIVHLYFFKMSLYLMRKAGWRCISFVIFLRSFLMVFHSWSNYLSVFGLLTGFRFCFMRSAFIASLWNIILISSMALYTISGRDILVLVIYWYVIHQIRWVQGHDEFVPAVWGLSVSRI